VHRHHKRGIGVCPFALPDNERWHDDEIIGMMDVKAPTAREDNVEGLERVCMQHGTQHLGRVHGVGKEGTKGSKHEQFLGAIKRHGRLHAAIL